jgi:chitodextrinase
MKKILYGGALGALLLLCLASRSLALNPPGGPPQQPSNPPVVSIVFPANGASVSSTVVVSGTASDTVEVLETEISIDGGAYIPVSGTSTWTYSWNTTQVTNGSHTLEASSTDIAGNSGVSSIVTVTVNNPAVPPQAPTDLTAGLITTSTISFSWNPSVAETYPIAGYDVYRNGSNIGTTSSTGYTDTNLTASTTYSYTVAAYDTQGNISAQSAALVATTLASSGDTQPPTVPTNLVATAVGPTQINLTWDASQDNVGVEGYEVFRGGSLLASPGNVTSYSDTSVAPDATYTYTVLAYDAAGNQSAQSSPASATTPSENEGGGGCGDCGGEGGGQQGVGGGTVGGGAPQNPMSTSTLEQLLQSLIIQLNSLIAQENTLIVPQFTRNLTIGSIGNDVSLLQEFLDLNGYTVSTTGYGSLGDESIYFGHKTAAALAAFQKANGIRDTGFFGPITRAFMQKMW